MHVCLNEQDLIDVQTWLIDSTAIRAIRAASGAGKKECLKNPKTMRSVVAGVD
ncbi:hypothetical protein PSCICN_14070 [Pseudomonas cichorii]|nr:hypothetical protein PSCICN_14070 [Pseudomonas cichorii]